MQTTDDGKAVKSTFLPVLHCPSETNANAKLAADESVDNWPLNYAVNNGPWLVWNPTTQTGGLGAFIPNGKLRPSHFTDGLTKTMGFAEVKAFAPFLTGAAAANPTMPNDPSAAAVFPPNTTVLCTQAGVQYDMDWVNQSEIAPPATGAVSYSVVGSRSYHKGLVNVSFMDGSVHTIADSVDLNTWQALATRASGDVINANNVL